jgi:hypothetical protein
MSKASLGPWTNTRDGLIYDKFGNYVAAVRPDINNEMFEANMRLIAAAPEMLEALLAVGVWTEEMYLRHLTPQPEESGGKQNLRGYTTPQLDVKAGRRGS